MSNELMKKLKLQLLKSDGFSDYVLRDLMSRKSDITNEEEDRVAILFKEYTKEMSERIRENIDEYPQEIIGRLTEEGFFLEQSIEKQTAIENR